MPRRRTERSTPNDVFDPGDRSIQLRLGLGALAGMVGVALATGALLLSTASTLFLHRAQAELGRQNDAVAVEINHLTNKAADELLITRQNPAFNRFYLSADPTSRQAALADVQQAIQYLELAFEIDKVCLISASGKEEARCRFGVLAGLGDLSSDERGAPFFEAALRLPDGAVYRSDIPYFSSDTQQWVLAHATPIALRDSRKVGLLHFEIPINVFISRVESMGPDGGYSFLTTGDGRILWHPRYDRMPEPTQNLVGGAVYPLTRDVGSDDFRRTVTALATGSGGRGTFHDGDEFYEVVAQPVFDGKWMVATVQPHSMIYRPGFDLAKQLFLIVVPLFGISVALLSWYVARLLAPRDARFRAMVDFSSDVIMVVGPDLVIRYLTPSARRALGYEPSTLRGTSLRDCLHPDDVASVTAALGSEAADIAAAPRRWRLRNPEGDWRPVEVAIGDLRADPAVRGFVLNMRDVTEREALVEELMQQALTDPLTGLGNRLLLNDRLKHALQRAHRSMRPFAVLFVDLDNFKTINDSLGHAAGDELLVAVAHRFQLNARPSDTVVRLGGDEFALLLEDLRDPLESETVARRLLEHLSRPLMIQGRQVFPGGSIGIANSSLDTRDSDEVLRNADLAMYLAKSRGKAQYAVFEPGLDDAAQRRLTTEANLRRAINHSEFVLYYQPTVDLATGRIRGFEALIRWDDPEKGLVPPLEFIPIAEETGLIIPIGRWVVTEACRQARAWQDQFLADSPLTISVNLSPRQVQDPSIVEDVARAVWESGLAPECLVLEITESLLIHDTVPMVRRLHELKQLGVRLAIDDFGTGYSSLSYLQRFPIDILKIDKSFVDGLTSQSDHAALVQAVIQLGQTLHLQTTAEGIEQPDQVAFLRMLGCDLGQGYHFARPLDPAAIEGLLTRTWLSGLGVVAA